MRKKHLFDFVAGFDKLLHAELTFDEARPKGFELAKQVGKPVKMFCFNEPLSKWDFIGTYQTDGETMIDSWGEANKFDPVQNEFRRTIK
jgi:hypothetical protein